MSGQYKSSAVLWKKYLRLGLRQRIFAGALSCLLFVSTRSFAENAPSSEDPVALELLAFGKHGDAIAHAREQVLEILQNENACSAWFQESDPDPAAVFQSLHFEMENRGPSHVYSMKDGTGMQLFKSPWAAKAFEYGGRNSTILLNANGPFFHRSSRVMELDIHGMLLRPGGNYPLTVSSFNGNSPEAKVLILLHELGHIVGRIPEDDDSWDGRSSRNTAEVLRHCQTETRAVILAAATEKLEFQ